MSQTEHADQELDDYLSGDSELSRLYRQTRVEATPPAVDHFVLESAQRVQQRKSRRWLIPIATAAIVVLGLTTTLSLLHDQAIISPDTPFATGESGRPAQAEAPGEPGGNAMDQAEFGKSEVQESRAQKTVPPRERLAPSSASPPQPAHRADDSTAGSSELSAQPQRRSLRNATPPPGAAAQKSTSEESSAEVEPNDIDGPAQWIARIRALRQAGLEEAARREFDAFRTQHPEAPLPADLQDLKPTQ